MKFVIWLCAAFVYGLIQTTLSALNISLGTIPTFIIISMLFSAAKKLCNIWDKKHNVKKIKEKEPSLIVLIVIGIILFAIVVWCCISTSIPVN